MHIVIRKAVAVLLILRARRSSRRRSQTRKPTDDISPTHAGKNPPGHRPTHKAISKGKKIAERRSFSKSGTGLAVGLLSGLIGTGIGYFIIGPDEVPHHLTIQTAHKGAEYQLGFSDAYKKVIQTEEKNHPSPKAGSAEPQSSSWSTSSTSTNKMNKEKSMNNQPDYLAPRNGLRRPDRDWQYHADIARTPPEHWHTTQSNKRPLTSKARRNH